MNTRSAAPSLGPVRRPPRRSRADARCGAVLLALLLVAVGCSSSDDSANDSVDTDDAPGVSAPTDTTEATVPEDELEPSAASLAQEDGAGDTSTDFIDLPYWEVFLIDGISRTQQPDEDCARPESDVVVCEYQLTGSMVASQIGRATEVQTGTSTTYSSETCDSAAGSGAVRTVEDGTGTITSEWGDDLYFRVRTTCGLVNWVVEGGTGRFLDATGRISGVLVPPIPGAGAVNSGTLTVRADLWEDVLPPAAG